MKDDKSESDNNAIKKMASGRRFIGQSICSGLRTKFAIACDSSRPRIVRFFAGAELVCQPVSIISVVVAIAFAVLRHTGVWTPPPVVSVWVIPILVAAAVGYLTNWIAITMLFEPYERTWRHWLPWATFGLWRQGLLPKNKSRIAAVLANQVATKLIRPEQLADDLCAMVGDALKDKEVLGAAQKMIQEQVASHGDEIVAFLVPRIERAILGEINRLVTAENIISFWDAEISHRIESEETRDEIAELVIGALRPRIPGIVAKVKPTIVVEIRKIVGDKYPLLSFFFGVNKTAAEFVDSFLGEITKEEKIKVWIRHPLLANTVRDELAGFVKSFRVWLASPEGSARVGGFVEDIRARFKHYLETYLRETLAPGAKRILTSEKTWKWVSKLIPIIRPSIEDLIRNIGTHKIIDKLDIEERVKTAVDGMDMVEFHEMLNQVMAEHLGAIQVLGYLLGALAGLLLVFS